MDAERFLRQYEQRLNDVLDYVDRHYSRPLSLEQLAKIASFSPFHFHRIFKAYVGETPRAFIERLRLQKAVAMIERSPRKSISEIAIECGFGQSSDLSRSFSAAFGYPPSKHQIGRLAEDSKIRQDLHLSAGYGFRNRLETIQGDHFKVRVEHLPAQRIAFVRLIGVGHPDRMMAALGRLLTWGRRVGIYPGATLVATSPDLPDIVPPARYRMDLCMIIPEKFTERGAISFSWIPQARYAMVHCAGDIHKVERCWNFLFADWLPTSGYEPTDLPYVELFRNSDDANGWSHLDLDCCVPIRRIA